MKEWKVFCVTRNAWVITDGTARFLASSKEEANWLCDVLNTEIEVNAGHNARQAE
jgi:hypothetical protein